MEVVYKLSMTKLNPPKIMGVLNVTPDSFSDGGLFLDEITVLSRVETMLAEGADYIDVGAESTRPGADIISVEDEINRLKPFLSEIRKRTSVPISLDTTKSEVAKFGLDQGVDIINDVSGLSADSEMVSVVGQYHAGLVLMHRKGVSKVMQANPKYRDIMNEVFGFLSQAVQTAKENGINTLWIDPGIGFGKTTDHNVMLLNRLSEFKALGCPILIGVSRKSVIGELTGEPVEKRLIGSVAAAIGAWQNGADVIRVHDVKAHVDAFRIMDMVINK